MPILTTKMHEGFCDWPYQTRDARRRELAFCAGCGLFVSVGFGRPKGGEATIKVVG